MSKKSWYSQQPEAEPNASTTDYVEPTPAPEPVVFETPGQARQYEADRAEQERVAREEEAARAKHAYDEANPVVPEPEPSTIELVVAIHALGNDTLKLVAAPLKPTPSWSQYPDGTSIPVWSSSSPSLVITKDTADETGLTVIVHPGSPAKTIVGAMATVSYQLAGNVTAKGVSGPIDVVKGGHKGHKVVSRGK